MCHSPITIISNEDTEAGNQRKPYQSLHDLWKEEVDRLQRHTQADLNNQECPGRGVLEDRQSSTQLELFIDYRRTVCLHSVDSNFSFLGSQEVGRGSVERQVPECKCGNEDSCRSFDDEQVAPWFQSTAVNLEDTEGEKTGECTGDRLCGVEDGESAGEFASTVEPSILVRD